MKRRVLSLALALVMLLSLVPISAMAEGATSGKYTDDNGVTYTLESGTLTVSGTGECSSAWQNKFDTTAVTSAVVKDGVMSIGDFAFAYCGSLTSVNICSSVTSIGSYAFYGTAYYENTANWNDDVLYIDDCLIEASYDFTGSYSIKSGTRLIANGAFDCCQSLTEVEIPETVAVISHGAFGSCIALTSVVIADGVERIADNAFVFCSALTSVTIPESVTIIEDYAFTFCNALNEVLYSATEEQWGAISIGEDNNCLTNAKIHYNYHPHVHSYTDAVTAPTCTERGYTTHSCSCGASVVDSYVEALGHSYENNVCTVCGAEKPPVEFTDVAETAYYAKPVAWAVANNITGGYNDGTFRPMAICTRAQIVTFIWRANGSPEPLGTAKGFTDVAEGAYYYKAVLWAAEEGITGGFDDGGFHPDELVTRAQAMTFLWRAEGKPAVPAGTVNTFADVPDGAYYHDAVLWAVANGVTGGYDSTTFGSMDGCTRAQIVTFLYRDMAQ